jgi:hypothetical protein
MAEVDAQPEVMGLSGATTITVKLNANDEAAVSPQPGLVPKECVGGCAPGQSCDLSTGQCSSDADSAVQLMRACSDAAGTSGGAWHDAGGDTYTCGGYYTDANKCSKWGGKFRFDSMVAQDACCTCGGGSSEWKVFQNEDDDDTDDNNAVVCADKTAMGATWHDDGGEKYTCAWYAGSAQARCDKYGAGHAFAGMTASQACCACDGGELLLPQCQDLTSDVGAWHDAGGAAYACSNYYAMDDGTRCDKYGGKYENEGFTANQACCACGGGHKV